MFLIHILFQIVCFQPTFIYSLDISPGSPVPHAKLLDQALSFAHLNNYTEPNSLSVFDYLFGNNITETENLEMSEHLDISVLSPENIDKIVEQAKRKYLAEERTFNASLKGISRRHWDYIYYKNNAFINKSLTWMQQSIYETRRRLEVTRPFRKKFHTDISYNIGVLFGIIKELVLKAESVYTSMWRIHLHHQFIWFIFSYQRLLSFNIDITYIVERMFEFQKKWNVLIGRKEKGASEEETPEGEPNEVDLSTIGNNTSMITDIGAGMDWGSMEMIGAQAGGGNAFPGAPGAPGEAPGPPRGAPGEAPGPHQGGPGGAPGPPRGAPQDQGSGMGPGGHPWLPPGHGKHGPGGPGPYGGPAPNDQFVAYGGGGGHGPAGNNGPEGDYGPLGSKGSGGGYGPGGGPPPY